MKITPSRDYLDAQDALQETTDTIARLQAEKGASGSRTLELQHQITRETAEQKELVRDLALTADKPKRENIKLKIAEKTALIEMANSGLDRVHLMASQSDDVLGDLNADLRRLRTRLEASRKNMFRELLMANEERLIAEALAPLTELYALKHASGERITLGDFLDQSRNGIAPLSDTQAAMNLGNRLIAEL